MNKRTLLTNNEGLSNGKASIPPVDKLKSP